MKVAKKSDEQGEASIFGNSPPLRDHSSRPKGPSTTKPKASRFARLKAHTEYPLRNEVQAKK